MVATHHKDAAGTVRISRRGKHRMLAFVHQIAWGTLLGMQVFEVPDPPPLP